MTERRASCRCGAIRLTCTGEPGRVSICHCLACQKRSGSAFAAQARFPHASVAIDGDPNTYVHAGDSGNLARFLFCPACGTNVAYVLEHDPDVIAVPLGAFDDPYFAAPAYSVYENRKHRGSRSSAPASRTIERRHATRRIRSSPAIMSSTASPPTGRLNR